MDQVGNIQVKQMLITHFLTQILFRRCRASKKQIQNTRKFQELLQQVSEICFSAFLASPWIVSKTSFKASPNLDKVHVHNMYDHLEFLELVMKSSIR